MVLSVLLLLLIGLIAKQHYVVQKATLNISTRSKYVFKNIIDVLLHGAAEVSIIVTEVKFKLSWNDPRRITKERKKFFSDFLLHIS